MKIAIIGTGGVGAYFGAKLVKAGFDVTFLARGEHLTAIKTKGLLVKSILGDFQVENLQATDKISAIGKVDLVMLAVKAWQIREVREELNTLLHDQTLVLPLQNGVLAAEELLESIDAKHVLGGLCRIISKIESPGVVNHFGVNPSITFGALDLQLTESMQGLKSIFDRAGINSQISSDIQADLWKKFISICVSGLMAVSRTTYGELRSLPETRQMMLDLLAEIFQLSQKMGVNVEPDFVDKAVAFIDSYPPTSTSSLTRDVWEGKPSEIEYQNGTVVRLGKKIGLPTPINAFVYHCILPMEKKARRI